ncbi:MAG: cupin domain-containing protein [Herbiconiux sp.]|nr:cupin domain-containing protein [Herbiconiux sp.]
MPEQPVNALTAEVPLGPIEAGVERGDPRTGALEWGAVGGSETGLWQITPGVVTDTEVDELFVVLYGAATVELLDGGETLLLEPGSVGRFAAGTRTRWTVTETLRKVYVIAGEPAGGSAPIAGAESAVESDLSVRTTPDTASPARSGHISADGPVPSPSSGPATTGTVQP